MKDQFKTSNMHAFFYTFLLLILLGLNDVIYSQETECNASSQRRDWFYGQRRHPLDSIPPESYANAMNQKNLLEQTYGYKLLAPNRWTEIGPKPFQPHPYFGTLVSGRISALIYDKRDQSGNTIYIAPAGGGVWKTIDGGVEWVDISGDLLTLVSGAIAIDYETGAIYYGSGTNHYFGTEYRGMGMFKTTDEQHWEHISSGLWPQTQIFRIAINPNNTQNIFIAEGHGLYRTDNGGTSWYKVLPEDPSLYRSCTDVCFSPDGSKVYAIGPSSNFFSPPYSGIGFWKSENDQEFEEIPSGTGYPHSGATAQGRALLAVSAAQENLIYVLSYDDGSNVLYIYKSTNSGSNFSSFTLLDQYNNNVWAMGSNAGFNQMLKCSDFNPDICFIGFQDLYKTEGNQNWVKVGGYGTPVHPDIHTLDFNPNPSLSYSITVGSDGGVYCSENLGNFWSNMNQSLGLAQMFRVASNTYNTNIIVGGLEDEGIGYKDASISPTFWKSNLEAYSCDGGLVLASPFKSNYYIGGLAACRELNHSTNGGINFPEASGYYGSSAWIAPAVNHPTQPGVLYTMRHGSSFPYYSPYLFFKSTNYGASWFVDEEFENTIDYNQTPQVLAISPSNPNLIIFANGNASDFWHRPNELYKLINDGNGNWSKTLILTGGTGQGVADRYFTHVEIDPVHENEIYLTVSGYGTGHVFRSVNSGANWTNISGNLPDNPSNDLVIHYTSSNTKELIVSCDIGIFRTDAETISWQLVASGLPNAPAMDLDLNRLSGILRTPTFGRGVWEVQLDATTYVQDVLYITDNVTIANPIVVASGGKLILGHSSVGSFAINFINDAKIIVEDGGTLLANSNVPITISSTGTSSCIEVNGQTSNCVLYNCTFSNTTTPVVINGGMTDGIPPVPEYGVILHDCHFSNAPVSVTNRNDVHIQYCDWINNTGQNGIIASGANGLYLLYNEINYISQVTGSHAIQVSQSDNVAITRSTISHCDYPITVSNGTYYIRYSDINSIYPSTSEVGIYLNGVNNGHLIANVVNGYKIGYFLNNQSSPTMLLDTARGSNSYGDKYAIYCSNSSPRLFPSVDDNNNIIWDAGLNTLRNDASNSFGLVVNDEAAPLLDYGYNTIYGTVNIEGDYPYDPWYVRCNTWINDPPVFNTSVYMEYEPTDCTPPDSRPGQNNYSIEAGSLSSEKDPELPPQSIIVNYGNGLIDTFEVGTTTASISTDIGLLGSGDKNMYAGNFENAITKYSSVISNYQDSNSALIALNRIFYCYDRMNADTNEYSTLRNYYLNLVSSNTNDTTFARTASELSRKCLVQQREFINAIYEYEHVVTNSNDSAEILASEISILEIYILLSSEQGDAASFTGQLGYLKPSNLTDAMNKIREKMGHKQGLSVSNNTPKVFSLSQNYPNPFNPITKINYSIPNSINVSLKVYDILGRLVKTLVNEYKDAGSYFVTFDGSSLASGVYFYRIEAGNFVQSKKMVLVK